MCEIKEDINLLKYATQYDVKHSTAIIESIRLLMVDEKSAKTAVSVISKQIANATTKELGFDILVKLLPDCGQNVLDENAKNWCSYAVSKHQDEIVAASRFQFLVELYHRCHANQEFYKSIVTNLLPKIVDTCIWVHVKTAEAEYALNCLYYTMKYFSSACIVHKRKIEEYVIKFLDSCSKMSVIVQAAKCYHILNQVGGAGPNGTIHIKSFEDNFEKLYQTLNLLYDSMFENINEFREATATQDMENVVKFREIPTYLGTMDIYKILSRRMENTVIFLIEMLQTDYKVKKTVKPAILNVIQRGLDIHVHGNENDMNRVLFNQIVQQHQIKLMYLLKALIQSLQHSFMRHSTIKMLFRYLARVTDCNCYNANSFYKSSIYNVIKFWLQASGEQIDARTYEKLVEIIVKDITPNKTTLVLLINTNNSKSKGKNKNTPGVNKVENATEAPRIQETQVQNCLAALGLLETLLKSVHLNIKKTSCAQLFHVITNTALDICADHFCSPYTNQQCRHELFKVLIAVFDQHVHTIDIDLAVNILALAQRGHDVGLSTLCQHGLKAIEKIVHPIQAAIAPAHANIENEDADNTFGDQKEKKENATVTILADYLIKAGNEVDKVPVANEEMVDVISVTESSNVADETTENAVVEIEISDNECEVQQTETAESIPEVVALDEESEPLPKKRKADDQEVIYTFDISQGEGEPDGDDILGSFVDEVN